MARATPHRIEVDDLRFALDGLHGARDRHLAAYQAKDLPVTSTSAADVAYWAWAIDEHLQDAAEFGVGYRERRSTDDGELVVGLRFVRDRQAHQLVRATQSDNRMFFGGGRPGSPMRFPPLYIAGFAIWCDLEDIRPGDPQQVRTPFYAERRDAYGRLFAGKSTYRPIVPAVEWLEAEVAAAAGVAGRAVNDSESGSV